MNPDSGCFCKSVDLCHTVESGKRVMKGLSTKNPASNMDKARVLHKVLANN